MLRSAQSYPACFDGVNSTWHIVLFRRLKPSLLKLFYQRRKIKGISDQIFRASVKADAEGLQLSSLVSFHPAGSCQHKLLAGQPFPVFKSVFIREPAWPWYELDVVAQGSRDQHPPILPAEWKSNGRLHLQTRPSIVLLHDGILRAEELCTLNISFHRTHHPPPHRPHHPPHPRLLAGVTTLPVNKSFPAQVTFGMFNLREVQMCSAKRQAPLLFMSIVIILEMPCLLFFFSVRRERAKLANLSHKINHIYSPFSSAH